MRTLFEIVNDQQSSESLPRDEQIIRSAWWAGMERGRGDEARAVHAALAVSANLAGTQRYHRVYRSALAEVVRVVSAPRDDSAEILAWDFASSRPAAGLSAASSSAASPAGAGQ